MRPSRYSLGDDTERCQATLGSWINFHVPCVNVAAFSFTEKVWSILNVTLIFLLADCVVPVQKQARLLHTHDPMSFAEMDAESRFWAALQFENELTSSFSSFLHAVNAVSIVKLKAIKDWREYCLPGLLRVWSVIRWRLAFRGSRWHNEFNTLWRLMQGILIAVAYAIISLSNAQVVHPLKDACKNYSLAL